MDRDALDGPVAHAAVISHNILDLLDGDILELCFLHELADIPGRVNELILVNEVKQSPLDSPPFDLLLFHFLIEFVEGSLVLLDFGNNLRDVRRTNSELLGYIGNFLKFNKNLEGDGDLILRGQWRL